MAKFAAETSVSSDRSIMEIKMTVGRYGASGFAYMEAAHAAVVMFEAKGRRVKFLVPLPDRNAKEFRLTSQGRARAEDAARAAYEQAIRQRWRALALVIKAKLEAVETGITTFESEFLAHIVLPNGSTVGEWAAPQIEVAYETGSMPPLLPMLTTGTRAPGAEGGG
jgi:hypothetical protein